MAVGRAGGVLGLAALLLACAPNFENSTTIKDLRLLVVMAEPPEVLIDVAAWASRDPAQPVAPEELPRFTMTALLVDPQGGGRPIDFRAEACGNDPLAGGRETSNRPGRTDFTVSGAPCPDGSQVVLQGSAAPDSDGVALVTVDFAPGADFLVAAVRGDPLGVELGLPITVSFVFRAGDEEVVALKRVLLSPRLSPDQQPNRNPRIGLYWRAGPGEPRGDFASATLPRLAPGAHLRIGPSGAEAEPYQTRAFSRSERRFVTEQVAAETLRYAYFATRGEFAPGTVSTEPSPLRADPVTDLESDYIAPVDGAGAADGFADIFVIVRDERGGAGFRRARLLLER